MRRLTDQEGQKLQQIVRRGNTSSVRYRRGRSRRRHDYAADALTDAYSATMHEKTFQQCMTEQGYPQ
ncbi:hypothetical protein [Streptomyces sp. NPDC056821]|uniref:hypothetical protein n=1 Tax=unclassified Streptomyces TaxID=2593676 RepID=UPI0036C347D8